MFSFAFALVSPALAQDAAAGAIAETTAAEEDDGLGFLDEDETSSDEAAVIQVAQAEPVAEAELSVMESEDVAAAEATAPAPEAAQAPRRPQLDEIIVTAQKRAEDVQDVPLSVTAIGGEELKEKNMADLNTVAAYAPNLSVLATPTFNFIYMRGVGSDYNRGFEQSVGIIIDEVFYGRPSYVSNGLLDLAAVEVLRGPQGTLYGKNSAAGALHLITASPEPDWSFDADAKFGERQAKRFRAAFGGPLFSDELSFRMAYMQDFQEGDIINTTLGGREERNLDNENIRLKLLWEPTANFDMLLTANGATVDQHGSGTQIVEARPRHLAAFLVFDELASDDVFDEQTQQDAAGYVDRDVWDVTLKAEWELGEHIITSLSNYAWFDEDVFFDADFSPIPFITLGNNEDYRQISQELRWTSPPGEIEWVGGLFYFYNSVFATYDVDAFVTLAETLALTGEGEIIAFNAANSDPAARREFIAQSNGLEAAGQLAAEQTKARQDLAGTPLLERSATIFDQESDSFAAFGQITWHATERWSVTTGLRVNYEIKTVDAVHTLCNFDLLNPALPVPTLGLGGLGFLDSLGLPVGDLATGAGGGDPVCGNGNPIDTAGNPQEGFTPGGATTFPVIQGGNTQFSATRERKEFNVSPKVSTQVNWTEDFMTYITIAQGYKAGGFNAQPLNADQLEYEEEKSIAYELGFKSEWLDGAARLNVSGFWTDFDDIQVSAFNGVSFVVSNAASATIRGIEWEAMFVPVMGLFLTGNGAWTDASYNEFETGPCAAESGETAPCDLTGETLNNVPEWQSTLSITVDEQFFDLPFRFHSGLSGIYASKTYLARDLDEVDVREGFWTLRGRVGVRGLEENWHVMMFFSNITEELQVAGSSDVPTFRGSHFGGRIPKGAVEIEARFQF
ncbi:MAG: TonB-dependent receptor [Alphaproteobacteria bacterium]